jgi:flagellar hook-associated protein 3 FlgL
MRISTNTIYDLGATKISELQAALVRTQQQISANRRMLSPSDDPIAAARALEVTQSQSLNTQYATNRTYASNSLSLEESVLQSVTSLIQDVKTQTIEAGNAAYDDTQRRYIATDLRGRLEELIGFANTRDSEGNYLFSGFQTSAKAFSSSASGVVYAGDQGQRNLQVGAVRQIAISDSGDSVFGRIRSTGTFVTAAATTNVGAAVASPLAVVDSSLLTGHSYDVVFSDDGLGNITYSAYDITNDPTRTTPVSTGAYTSPQVISFDGLQMTLTGVPSDTDTMTVRPSGTQSIFKTLEDLISLLETPSAGAIGNQNLNYGLGFVNSNLDSALDNILTVRASVGSRLKELEKLDSAGQDLALQHFFTLSQLQDLDYVKAISDLTMQKTTLEAAQQSYVKIINLSLFDYI